MPYRSLNCVNYSGNHMRPFKYGRVVSGNDFCGRRNSIEELRDYISMPHKVLSFKESEELERPL